MNIKEIKERVLEIEKIGIRKKDDEGAHSLEDNLYKDFIEFVSINGNGELKKMAKAVLKTKYFDFDRWYA